MPMLHPPTHTPHPYSDLTFTMKATEAPTIAIQTTSGAVLTVANGNVVVTAAQSGSSTVHGLMVKC